MKIQKTGGISGVCLEMVLASGKTGYVLENLEIL